MIHTDVVIDEALVLEVVVDEVVGVELVLVGVAVELVEVDDGSSVTDPGGLVIGGLFTTGVFVLEAAAVFDVTWVDAVVVGFTTGVADIMR